MKTNDETVMQNIITAGWAVKSDGHVESPTGHFALVEIPEHMGERDEMMDAVYETTDAVFGDDWEDEYILPESGWYIVTEDSQGFVHLYRHSGENAAKAAYARFEREYSTWNGADES